MPATTVTSAGRITLQDARNAEQTNFSETKIATTANTTINGVAFRYTNVVFPTSGYHVLTVNYFDDYNFPNAPTIPSAIELQTVYYNTTVKPKGLTTGTWTRVLETSTLYKNEIAYTLYDYKARPIRSYSQNYLGGYTYVDSKLDFTGKPEYTITKHKLLGSSVELTTREDFVYSDQGRLLTQTNQINTGAKQLIVKNDYDELGQLIGKKVGGTDITGAVGLQTVNYAYNIRGWLKQINDPASLGTDLFGFNINYNTVSHGATPLYNGNISETEWKTQSDNVLRWYKYGYDKLNRITSGIDNTADTRYSLSSVAYDPNGNITNLTRRGQTNIGATSFGVMDQLTYTYQANSNKLTIVSDAGNDTFGFKDDQIGTGTDISVDYTYDANGNMLKDLNKAMTSNILYNHLNLPIKVTFASGNISYIYDATGVKLRKIVSTGTTTDYAGNYVYENGALQFFNTAEGYVEPNGGTGYNYVYQYKDHLGNIRLSYKDISTTSTPSLQIVEENNYYPFGLKHKGYNNNIISEHKFTYNGQEFNEDLGLNVSEMDFRQYDPALGRFSNPDRLAEYAPSLTPFRFAFNNPVYWSDPSGLYEIDGGNISVNNENGNDEVKKLLAYIKNNEGASVDDIAGHIFSSGDFAYDLDEVTITGGSSSSEATAKDNIGSQINSASNKISSFGGNINFTKERNIAEWAWDNKQQIGVTAGAAFNAYAGYQEIVAGVGMMATPTGVTQVAGGYAIADGIVRIASAPLQIYGTWTGNTSLENAPSNLLGSIGFMVDNGGIEGDWRTGGRAQLTMGLMGNFGLSRGKLIQTATKGFTNANKWKNIINIGNATWQIVRPYKDAIQLKQDGKL